MTSDGLAGEDPRLNMPCGDFKGWEGMSPSLHESSMTHMGDLTPGR